MRGVVNGQVPVVSFSTDWTQAGGNTYVMGFLPFAQVARVVQYAQDKGYGRLSVFAPRRGANSRSVLWRGGRPAREVGAAGVPRVTRRRLLSRRFAALYTYTAPRAARGPW